MFTADYKILETAKPNEFIIEDISTGDEVLISRTITLYKTDLMPLVYTFPVGETEILIGDMSQDFAFIGEYKAVPSDIIEGSTYTKIREFVTLGYTKKAKYDRNVDLELDESIVDKKDYKKDTNEIFYHMEAALTFASNGNLVDAQNNLDYIKDITGYNSL